MQLTPDNVTKHGMTTETITLVSTADEKFFPGLLVAMSSAIECASGKYAYDVKVLNGGITDEQWLFFIKTLQSLAAKKSIDVAATRIDLSTSDLAILPTRRGSPLTNARLLLPVLFPDLNFAVYLDSDVLCFRGIEEFHEKLSYDYALSACLDPIKIVANDRTVRKYHEKSAWGKPYFNAGVVGINIQRWKENFDTIAALLKSGQEFKYADQSLLNRLFLDQWSEVHPLANHVLTLENCSNYPQLSEPANLHFVGPGKPWLTNQSNFYRRYVDQLFDQKLLEFDDARACQNRTTSESSLIKARKKASWYKFFLPHRGKIYANALRMHDQVVNSQGSLI